MLRINQINNLNYSNYKKQAQNVKSYCAHPYNVSFKGAEKFGSDAILELLGGCVRALENGGRCIVDAAADLIQKGDIREAIDLIGKNVPSNGKVSILPEGVEILTKKWDNSPARHIFKNIDGYKHLGLVNNLEDLSEEKVLLDAFGIKPKTTIGMVGWTNVKPDNVIKKTNNLTKEGLTSAYESAISEFFSPVDRYFVEGLGIDPKTRALVSSVSYSGVDKAIMDMGQQRGINTLTVTPFNYAIYGRSEHPFPTLITNTIQQYVDAYGRLSKNLVVTGGRDHAFKFDAGGKWLRNSEGIVIPVDVLKDFKGIVVPATKDGKIENAAALAYETFSDPIPKGLIDAFKNLPSIPEKNDIQHLAQKALASAIARDLGIIEL